MPIREALPPGIHEAGWLSSGLPWRRQHRVHCNTCGTTSDPHHDLDLIKIVAQAHTAFPDRDINRVLADAIDMQVQMRRDLHRLSKEPEEGP